MKSYRKELWFETPTRRAFVNITSEIEQCLAESGIREGLLLIKSLERKRKENKTMSQFLKKIIRDKWSTNRFII